MKNNEYQDSFYWEKACPVFYLLNKVFDTLSVWYVCLNYPVPLPCRISEMDLSTFHFWTCPFSILGKSRQNFKVGQPMYRAWSDCMDMQAGLALYWLESSLFSVVGCAGRPGSILLAKANYFRFQQGKG